MTDISPSRHQARAFFALSGLVPDRVAALFFGRPAARTLTFSSDAQITTRKNGKLTAPLSLLETGSVEKTGARKSVVDAVLPGSLLLKREIIAPASARRSFRNVASLDLQRQTPFQPKDVRWCLEPPKRREGDLHAVQWVAKQSDILFWKKTLAQSGLTVRRFLVETCPEPLADFSGEIAPHARRWRRINATLALAAAAFAAVSWLFPAWALGPQNERLKSAQASLQSEALALRKDLDALRAEQVEKAALFDLIFHRPLLSHGLRELTVALPDTVWVETLEYRPDLLKLNGEASGSAAELVLDLAKNRYFSNPRLAGPVSRTGAGAERFGMLLDLRGGG